MNGKRYILGVSLGNKSFTKAFAKKLFNWLEQNSSDHIDILIGDALEKVNYQVRKNMTPEEATLASKQRAKELVQIFSEGASGKKTGTRIILESESEYRQNPKFDEIVAEIKKAYANKGQFYNDVNNQVRLNLRDVNQQLVSKRLEELAVYILEELALFYVYFIKNPAVIEIYPGNNLQVKEKMFAGQYANELTGGVLPKIPKFINISQIIEL